jgi:hypothetical protein
MAAVAGREEAGQGGHREDDDREERAEAIELPGHDEVGQRSGDAHSVLPLAAARGRRPPAPGGPRARAHVGGEEVLHVGHLLREDAPSDIEHLTDEGIGDAVEDGRSGPAALDHPLRSQDAELLGRGGRLDLELAQKVAHAHLAVAEELENAETQGMAERLEQTCLEAMERLAVPAGTGCQDDAGFMNS